MSRKQMIFDALFQDQIFGPRNGLEPRDWAMACTLEYQASVAGHEFRHKGNGSASQHCFTIYAGTGSGKTKAVGNLASFMLNTKRCGQVVNVVPNRSILRKTQRDFRDFFGISLVAFHARRHAEGIPRTRQGYILTYAHLIQDPTLHRRICSPEPERTLVIFDEVHHLGDRNGWGDAAVEAFGNVPFVINLTGTPYRTGNERIPFVTYGDTDRDGIIHFLAEAPAGFTYTLGEAITDGICRKPLFCFHDATVKIRTDPLGPETTVDFGMQVNDGLASLRLRGAVKYTSTDRHRMLEIALKRCREENRKVIIFLCGDTEGDQVPTVDANELLPQELQELGISPDEYEIVTGDDKEAQDKIDRFGSSSKWILISINMISEGTDIPELSAAIFLTSVSAKMTTIQRIGRALRLLGPDDPHKDALIFMFADSRYVVMADEIEAEVRQEIDLRRKRRESPGEGGDSPESRCRAEAIGVGDGRMRTVKFHGREWPAEVFEAARERAHRRVKGLGLPPTMLDVATLLLMEPYDGNG